MIKNTKKAFPGTALTVVSQSICKDVSGTFTVMLNNDEWIGEKFVLIDCYYSVRESASYFVLLKSPSLKETLTIRNLRNQ